MIEYLDLFRSLLPGTEAREDFIARAIGDYYRVSAIGCGESSGKA